MLNVERSMFNSSPTRSPVHSSTLQRKLAIENRQHYHYNAVIDE